jgi:hypothetical protein
VKRFLLTAVAFSSALLAGGAVSDSYRANEATAADSQFQQVDFVVSTDDGSGAAYCGTSDPNPSLYYGGGWWTGWYQDYFFLRWARDHNHDCTSQICSAISATPSARPSSERRSS